MKILVCEDHAMCREAMVMALRKTAPEAQIDRAASLSEADKLIETESQYDLVLTDLMLPDSKGLHTVLHFISKLPTARIAVATGVSDPSVAAQARSAGAVGFVPKGAPMSEIVEAIGRLIQGQETFPVIDAENVDDRIAKLRELTPSQLKIVLAAARGDVNKQIAFDNGLTESTVKAHLAAAFKKLGVNNRVQATLLVHSLDASSLRNDPE